MSFFDGILKPMDVIVTNRQFCKQSNEQYGLDHPDMLQDVVNEFNQYNNLTDDREKAIQKACCLLSGLVFEQPFKNANKRTAVSLSLIMIRIHHHDIEGYKQEEKQKKFYKLLEKTMLKMEGDDTIKLEIENYLHKNIIRL